MRVRAITAYLGMGATAIVAYFLVPDGSESFVWNVIALSIPLVIVIGVRRFRPSRPVPWLLLAGGFGLWACGDILWVLLPGDSVSAGDIAYILGYPLLALGCLMMVRTDRRTSMPVVLGGARISLNASIGLVLAGAADDEPDEILRRADSAMYEAKRSGRGGWFRFGAEIPVDREA